MSDELRRYTMKVAGFRAVIAECNKSPARGSIVATDPDQWVLAADHQSQLSAALTAAVRERDELKAGLSPLMAAGLLMQLKAECEAQHARAETAVRERDEARQDAEMYRRHVLTPATGESLQRLRQCERELSEARDEIDATWKHIGMAYDCEPREYFEKEAPTNGFKYPLAQAIHHIWKREPKLEAAERTCAALREAAQDWIDEGFVVPDDRTLELLKAGAPPPPSEAG